MIEDRCENWGRAWREHRRGREAASFEGSYRSPQRGHWDAPPPPSAPVQFDRPDATLIDNAWQAMSDSYSQALLMAWYVARMDEWKCLIEASRVADHTRPKSTSQFLPALAMAHALLMEQLRQPATIRRDRIAERIRVALGIRAPFVFAMAAA